MTKQIKRKTSKKRRSLNRRNKDIVLLGVGICTVAALTAPAWAPAVFGAGATVAAKSAQTIAARFIKHLLV